jgi:hypothetical protein
VVTDENGLPTQRIQVAMEELTQGMDIAYAQNSGDRTAIKNSRQKGESVIGRVGTKASSDSDNPWPLGPYTQVIDTDQNSVVHFHCNLIRKTEADVDRTIGLQIFDQDDALVYENISTLHFKKGYDRISKPWIVRDSSGLKQASGMYTSLIWIDQSRAYEHKIKLISPSSDISDRTHNPNAPESAKLEKERDELQKKLYYPELFMFSLIPWIIAYLGIYLLTIFDSTLVGILTILGTVGIACILFVQTRKYLISSWWLSALLSFVCCGYYSLFLAIMSLITLINRRKYRLRLNEINGILGFNQLK